MTPEDWTGLTDAQRVEKRLRLLEEAVIFLLNASPATTNGMVEDRKRRARAILDARDLCSAPRASLEAAPVLDAEAGEDGWIPWEGGNCPVSPETSVFVRFGDGDEDGPEMAQEWNWSRDTWDVDPDCQIIAYRLSKEPR